VNVVVLGAGIIGLSAADELARRGARVTVIDMRSPGRGASQASAGILAPYVEAHGASPLLDLGVRSLDLFDEFVQRVSRDSGRPVEYRRSGTLQVALEDDEARRLSEAKAWLDARGIESEWFAASALRHVEPMVTARAVAGLRIPGHGFVNVPALLQALAQSARQCGARFESPVQALDVDNSPDRVRVRAGDREYDADVVVLAAGSWSGRIRVRGIPALPVRPVRGQLLHLRFPSADPRPATIVWGPRCYTVPWTDGSLLVGATMEDAGFDETATVDGVHELGNAVIDLLPAARGASLDAIRVGLRPALPDDLPAIGGFRDAPRVVAATGHFRNGILLAPLTAALVARLVLDGERDPALALTSPDRTWGMAGAKRE
jgi:glycine oxidase